MRSAPVAGTRLTRILVVDDDRRVRELLEIALGAQGFEVVTANDGEEGIKQAVGSRPDLVVLDVRLPKKSGLEVVEALRADPEDPTVPIILVSAASETEARLQAFARGADDYLSKPFSPKELIARIKRLVSRHSEARVAVQRARELERELARAQDETRRAHLETRRERRLRDLASGVGRDLLRSLDCEAIADQVLLAVQNKLGIGVAALLARGHGDELEPIAVRGDGFHRVAGLMVRRDGELGRVLAGLGRPVSRAELERIPELRSELVPFYPSRFTIVCPLTGSDGLEGILVMEERLDGTDLSRADVEVLVGLSEIAVLALQNGRQFRDPIERLLEVLAEQAQPGSRVRAVQSEAAVLVDRAARATALAPRYRQLLRHGMSLGGWGLGPDGRRELERLRALDPTGRVAVLADLLERLPHAAEGAGSADPDLRRAVALLKTGLAYAAARARGAKVEVAAEAALEPGAPWLDVITREAFSETIRAAARMEGGVA
jgi:DNA-binding response OmpR family regulator